MAGRPKGAVSQRTSLLRDALSYIVSENIDAAQEWLLKIEDPAKQLDLYLKMCEFAVPKLARHEHTGEDGGAIKVDKIEVNVVRPTT